MIAVYGASGHTGRFVVAELQRRGLEPLQLDRKLDLQNATALINCAGPFAGTADAAIAAALDARIPYLDIAAEVEVAAAAFEKYRDAPIPIVPSIAFYGGLADLLATTIAKDGDEIEVAYSLSSWRPTKGTTATIEVSRKRRNARRIVFEDGGLKYKEGPAPLSRWSFEDGEQEVVGEFTTADSITISSQIAARSIRTFMTTAPLKDLVSADAPDPRQKFAVEVRAGGKIARARGTDIYAISAPLVVEAAVRALQDPRPGARSAGARFDAKEFLQSSTIWR